MKYLLANKNMKAFVNDNDLIELCIEAGSISSLLEFIHWKILWDTRHLGNEQAARLLGSEKTTIRRQREAFGIIYCISQNHKKRIKLKRKDKRQT